MTKNLERAELVVMVCDGSDCKKKGSRKLKSCAKSTLKKKGMFRRSTVLMTRCTGNCKRAPVAGVLPHGVWVDKAKTDDIEELIQRAADNLKRLEAARSSRR